MKILIIDNYDSFTYNLYQYFKHFTQDVFVVMNDKITIEEIEKFSPQGIVISPGPGNPDTSGICLDAVSFFKDKIPVLGVCLGHQTIARALGGKIVKCGEPVHGKAVVITHDAQGIFSGIPDKIKVGLYHSLMADENTLPKELTVTARSYENVIMGIKHKIYPLIGVQFHPESILTEFGYKMIENWLEGIR